MPKVMLMFRWVPFWKFDSHEGWYSVFSLCLCYLNDSLEWIPVPSEKYPDDKEQEYRIASVPKPKSNE